MLGIPQKKERGGEKKGKAKLRKIKKYSYEQQRGRHLASSTFES